MKRFIVMWMSMLSYAWAAVTAHPISIDIHAEPKTLEENIRLFLETQMRLHPKNWTEKDVRGFLKSSEANVAQSIFPYGYFHPRIQTHYELTQQEGKTVWRLRYDVQSGSALMWRNIQLRITGEGQRNERLNRVMQSFPIQTGQPFNSVNYDHAKEEWLHTAANQGYVNAFFAEKKIRLNSAEQWADAMLTLDTGERYYFGALHLESPDYSHDFLKRFLNIHFRDPFSSKKLAQLEERMNGSGYFKQVVVNPEFERKRASLIPVHITVEPPARYRYKVGLGYGSFAGARVSAEAGFPHVNKSGHRFTTRLKVSSLLSVLSAKYSIPGRDPVADQYSLGVNAQRFFPENGSSISQVYSLGYTSTGKRLTTTTAINFLTERYTVKDNGALVYSGNSRLVYPSVSLNYIRLDDILNPQEGYGLFFNAQAGSASILSSTDFLQWQGKAKYVHSFSPSSQVLFRGGFGYTAVHDLMALPLSMRFFSGGSSTIRGYRDSSIGPGKYLQYVGGEYRHRLFSDNWRGALFWDGGTAGDQLRSPWVNSHGVGLIYQSVVGPIRFYLASVNRDVDDTSKGRKWAIDFSFGADFA